ncbi:MAG: helicase-exonuclease AddAB subunit AddB, partial [Peptococcaceae bacterium]|nr:helicase-exonuclease AddAB subunit AddB [Peptococcaceae bacterium]
MSLRFIYGRAGSGKTHYCLQEIKQRLQQKATHPLVLLVPEQYTFQAERDLMEITGRGGLLEAEVLSFRRLAFRVFNEAGGLAYPHLQAAGKSMLIYKVLNRIKEELPLLAQSADRQGFVTTVSTLLTEFKRYNVTPQELEATQETVTDELLKNKLAELAVIYKEYQELLAKTYRDIDDDLTLAAVKLDAADLFQGAEIWIDGFSGFTPQEYALIAKLGHQAARINISLCTDSLQESEKKDEMDVFAPVKECYRRLIRLAAEEGLEIEKPVRLGDSGSLPRFSGSEELSHLERYFFAYPHTTFSEPTKDIALFSALNIFSEIEAAARDIIGLCRDRGLRYRDIAVITGDLANYGRLIEVIFKEYDIPFFLDRKIEITQNPLIKLILAMLDIFIENWSYEAVFRYLKTGLAGIDKESIDRIENYVLACGIRGSQWTNKEKWDWSTEILPQGSNGISDFDLEEINQVRDIITAPLLAFRQKTKGRQRAVDICTALYEFLEEIGAFWQIEKKIEDFRLNGRLNLANEYAQIWNILMDVLDQTVEVLGEETMSIENFAKILKIGLDEYQVGLIPPSLDQVLVGNVDRSKSHKVKALYILGANDGLFPAAALEEGLLSDQDREALKKVGLELASDTKTKAFDEQFLIYRALTTASSYLRISWPLADSEGRSLRPSMVISRMRKLFPRIAESSDILSPAAGSAEMDLIAGRLPAFRHLVAKIGQQELPAESKALWREVYRWYVQKEDFRPHCEALKSFLAYKNIASPISPALIR